MSGHTTAKRGARVMVHLTNGEKIVDKFLDKQGDTVETENYRIPTSQIRSISYYDANKSHQDDEIA